VRCVAVLVDRCAAAVVVVLAGYGWRRPCCFVAVVFRAAVGCCCSWALATAAVAVAACCCFCSWSLAMAAVVVALLVFWAIGKTGEMRVRCN
jgi:hypothetical protein